MSTEEAIGQPKLRNDAKPLLVSVDDACRMLGLGRSTVWAMLARDEIPSKMIGRRRLIPVSAIEQMANVPEAA